MKRYEIVYRNEITAESKQEAIALALEDIQPDTLQVVEVAAINVVGAAAAEAVYEADVAAAAED
jgi:hypothetical protein